MTQLYLDDQPLGKYKVKKAREGLSRLSATVEPDWNEPIENATAWMELWDSRRLPKQLSTLWLFMHKRTPKYHQQEVVNGEPKRTQKCPTCGETEMAAHSYWDCEEVRKLWGDYYRV